MFKVYYLNFPDQHVSIILKQKIILVSILTFFFLRLFVNRKTILIFPEHLIFLVLHQKKLSLCILELGFEIHAMNTR